MALRVPLHMPRSAVPAALRVRLCTAGVRGSGVRFISSSKARHGLWSNRHMSGWRFGDVQWLTGLSTILVLERSNCTAPNRSHR